MTHQEFEELTGRQVTPEDYHFIEILYMAAGEMSKSEFCEELHSMCPHNVANNHMGLRRCLKEIGQHVATTEAELDTLRRETRQTHTDLAEILVGKACLYQDSDLYKAAIQLIGQREAVLLKLRLDLPLWDEDKRYILATLKDF